MGDLLMKHKQSKFSINQLKKKKYSLQKNSIKCKNHQISLNNAYLVKKDKRNKQIKKNFDQILLSKKFFKFIYI